MSFGRTVARRAEESAAGHLLRTLWEEIFNDHATIVAAGLAYSGIFGLLPALAAAAAVWRLVGGQGALGPVLQGSRDVLPDPARHLLQEFLTSVPTGFGGGAVLAFNLVVVGWVAVRAAGGLVTALNIIYDVEETRSGWRRLVLAASVGVAGIAMLFVALSVLALAPMLGDGALTWLRWPMMAALFSAGLAALFRLGPNRSRVHLPSLAWGTGLATALCVAASAGIAVYVGHSGSFGRLYGSMASVAVVLLWLYAMSLAVLIGAEVDATLQEQAEGPESATHTDEGPHDR